ncbi:MAG: hypothetical protein ACOYL5_19120 [Phototrophicaceae bacterium]|jgi:hypothetical protein
MSSVRTLPPNRQDLEVRLIQAASSAAWGKPGWLNGQVRLVLLLSQNNPVPAPSRPTPPITVAHARLAALIDLAAHLTPEQMNRTLEEIGKIPTESVRLELLSRLLPTLPALRRQEALQMLWRGLKGIGVAGIRARVLLRMIPLVREAVAALPTSFMAVFELAQALESPEARIRSLIALSRYVPPDLALGVQRSVLNSLDHTHDDSLRTNALATLAESLLPELAERAFACALAIHSPEERVRTLAALGRILPVGLAPTLQSAAIDAIETIRGVDARVNALTELAPYLGAVDSDQPFPPALTRALTLAVNLPQRLFQARALVILAPHLPRELQGEALAAVNSLPNEMERALLLAELARELPADMLIASLAIAHTLQQQDARVHALTALAKHLPEQARAQTIADAFAAASNLENPFERVNALVNLLDVLSVPLQEQALTHALETTRRIENPNTRGRALTLLSPHLNDALIERALDVALSLEDMQRQLVALIGLVPRLPANAQAAYYPQMLTLVAEIPQEFRRARGLLTLASHLPPALIPDALTIAYGIHEPFDRLSALIVLAQNSPPSQRPQLVGEAWRLVPHVDNGYDRASALASLAPLLPPSAEEDLTRAVGMAIGSIMDEYDQASAILLLAPLLATDKSRRTSSQMPQIGLVMVEALRVIVRITDPDERLIRLSEWVHLWVGYIPPEDSTLHHQLWAETLQRLAMLPLSDTIRCLAALVPVVGLLGDEGAVKEFVNSVTNLHEFLKETE